MIEGTYEEGVRDTLKFLQDNNRITLMDMPEDQFITLLSEVAGRKHK